MKDALTHRQAIGLSLVISLNISFIFYLPTIGLLVRHREKVSVCSKESSRERRGGSH
jgi:hypothetical protein